MAGHGESCTHICNYSLQQLHCTHLGLLWSQSSALLTSGRHRCTNFGLQKRLGSTGLTACQATAVTSTDSKQTGTASTITPFSGTHQSVCSNPAKYVVLSKQHRNRYCLGKQTFISEHALLLTFVTEVCFKDGWFALTLASTSGRNIAALVRSRILAMVSATVTVPCHTGAA